MLSQAAPGWLLPAAIRKRERSSSVHPDTPPHQTKRPKLSHPSFPPARFWDRLSEVPFTKNALREWDRRTLEVRRKQQHRRVDNPGRRLRSRATIREPGCRRCAQLPGRDCPPCLKQLQTFARYGGPDLTHLRGYQTSYGQMSSRPSLGRRKRPSQPSSKSLSKANGTPITTTTKNTGPYDRTFQQHLIDHNILPDCYEYPDGRLPPEPENMGEIRHRLAQPRRSMSPSKFTEYDFGQFRRANVHAAKEREVTTNVIPIIEGPVQDKRCVSGGIPFTNLGHLTDGTLVSGNPDLYHGARPEQLSKLVRRELASQIIPSTQDRLPLAPNYFLAVKGPRGTLEVAESQASYDGALGARGIHSLRTYGQSEPLLDNKAYTLTCTYNGGLLTMYTSHPIPPTVTGGQPGYAMTHIKSWALTGDVETCRQGFAAYRNGKDWAKQQRDEAINGANEKAAQRGSAATVGLVASAREASATLFATSQAATSQETIPKPSSNVPLSFESDTSADELSLECPPVTRTKPASSLSSLADNRASNRQAVKQAVKQSVRRVDGS